MSLHAYPNSVVPAETIEQMRRIANTMYQAGATSAAYLLASTVLDLVQATGNSSFYADTPLGVCPFCGEYEEIIKVADRNYGVCHEHRLYWYIGRSYLPSSTESKPVLYPPNLLNIYAQASALQVFPKDVCSCCGKYRTHALWCLYALEQPTAVHPSAIDVAY